MNTQEKNDDMEAAEGAYQPSINPPAETQDSQVAPSIQQNQDPVPEQKVIQPPPQAIQQQPIPQPPISPTPQEYDSHDAEFAHDLATKQIKPETYADLYGKKDTLGKIQTLFGLMISGAGAGLTHQPNALLEMMNKEIERDLDTQKQNVSNKQNFLNTAYNHELQQAQVKRAAYENLLTTAQTGQAEAGTKANLAQANAIDAQNAGLANLNRAKNHMLATTIQALSDKVAGNPNGQAVLTNVVIPAVKAQMQQNNIHAAGLQQLNNAANAAKQQAAEPQAAEPQAANEQAVDIDKMQKMINLGKLAPEMPGAIPAGDVPEVTRESNDVAINRNLAKIYDDSFKKLNNIFAAGKLNEGLYNAEVAAVSQRMAQMHGSQSSAESKDLLNGMFPAWKDFGSARKEKYNKTMESLEGNEAGTSTLARYELKTPFPKYSFDSKSKFASKQNQGPQVKLFNGIPYQQVSGGWQKVNKNNTPNNPEDAGSLAGTD